MRCDLHVHSYYSGYVNRPVLRHLGRDSYSRPEHVYAAAKRRGMDLVTLSDHDSIEGALQLAGRPDFFMSEEVTCVLETAQGESPRVLHLGVLGISEKQHEGIAARRTDPARLMSYLDEEKIAWCVNHLFSPVTGSRETADIDFALSRARALETRNSMMPEGTNALAAEAAAQRGLGTVGGSDAHAVASVARAYTVVEGATTALEFLDGIRAGRARAEGRSGSAALITRDVVTNFALGYLDNFRNLHRGAPHALRALGLLALAPLMPLLPLAAALAYGKELTGAMKIHADFMEAGSFGGAQPVPVYESEAAAGLPAIE
jgi:predicted metal-dependent phosphoesterase TrpH